VFPDSNTLHVIALAWMSPNAYGRAGKSRGGCVISHNMCIEGKETPKHDQPIN